MDKLFGLRKRAYAYENARSFGSGSTAAVAFLAHRGNAVGLEMMEWFFEIWNLYEVEAAELKSNPFYESTQTYESCGEPPYTATEIQAAYHQELGNA